jgi:hypothetical protein
MRPTASFARDVVEDLAEVLRVLRADLVGGVATEEIVERSGRPLDRVRGALSVLHAAGAVEFSPRWHGTGRGYARLWRFTGGGRIALWEPEHGKRQRRLYASRQAAIEASRRTQGPGADARRVEIVIDRRRGVTAGLFPTT